MPGVFSSSRTLQTERDLRDISITPPVYVLNTFVVRNITNLLMELDMFVFAMREEHLLRENM